jgi:hypothetical protein
LFGFNRCGSVMKRSVLNSTKEGRTTMRRRPQFVRFAFALLISPLLLWLLSDTALAAPPANDLFTGATPVGAGFNEIIDTTEATTDADDAQLNDPFFCGAPATDASVWYAFEATTDGIVVVDVSQSNYSAGVLVGTGSQGVLSIIACGPVAVSFFATAGTTYYVLAIDDQVNGDGLNGGSLNISFTFTEFVPTTVEVTLDRFGQFNSKTGTATLSGTYTCSGAGFVEVFGSASQAVGRIATITGNFSTFALDTCDGAPHPWSAEVFPQSGKFKGGKAISVALGFTCGIFECASGYVEQTVQLSGGGAKASGANQASNQVFLPSIITRE